SQFMLRMYLEKKDPRFKAALEKAIGFVLDAQFKSGIAAGGWPQRFPRAFNAVRAMPAPNWPPTGPGWEHLQPGAKNGDVDPIEGPGGIPGRPHYTGIFSGMEDGDYTNFVTFNDDVMGENIKFLLLCVFALGDTSLKAPVVAAMDCMYNIMYEYDGIPANSSNPNAGTVPQAGWGLQHLSSDTVDAYGVLRRAGLPAAARSYEPRGLSPSVSITNANQLFHYFRLTGDRKYIAKLDRVFAWIDTCGLRNDQRVGGDPESILTGTHARVVELDSNRPRFPHRYGTNIHNGAYYFDYDWRRTPSHYNASQNAGTATPKATLQRLQALSNAEIAAMVANSPLNVNGERPLPKYFAVNGEVDFPHLWANSVKGTATRTAEQTQALIDSLGEKNYWGTNQSLFTNPYTQDGPSAQYLGKEYMSTHVGDVYDTSPYGANQRPNVEPYASNPPVVNTVIESTTFVNNLGNLISFIEPVTPVTDPAYKA
ncbi:MAG TPA: pectate lyase, partial [Ramlibacter sp.]|nr:pectate lyase [Ramlibacter sp.]